ncbi:hypothetical protein ACVIF9_006387 [Bradyrhizobium sp. USDA 4350]
MEGIGRAAAMRRRIGQRLDHLVEFDHRSRPAMGDDQRPRLRVLRAGMDEVDVEPVDLGGELAESIELRLALPPIIGLGPIAADILDPLQWRALAPVVDQFGFRPAGPAQPGAEILKNIVADGDAKRTDGGIHGVSPGLEICLGNIGSDRQPIKPPSDAICRSPSPTETGPVWWLRRMPAVPGRAGRSSA